MATKANQNVNWYRSAEGMPPLNVQVVVQWCGREFVAKRHPNPRRKNRIGWLVSTSEGPIFFPPRGLAEKLGEHPLLWRPIDESRWVYMLPEPVPISRPRASSPLPLAPPAEKGETWWEDETQVSRSPEGSVSLREAEARVLRALRTMRAISFSGPSQKTSADVLARISAAPLTFLLEEAQASESWSPRFEPSGRDLDDFLTASAWFQSLRSMRATGPRPGYFNRAQMALVLRSADPPWTWASIGDKWGVSGERARQIYQASIKKVWEAANGRKPPAPQIIPPSPPRRDVHVHLD